MRKPTNLRRIKIITALALIFCISLPGCVSPAEFTEKPSLQSESPSAAEVRFQDYVYDPENVRYSCGSSAAVKENGYYLVINYSLYFYDVQADTVFPICTKASCLHKDETCDAYIYDRGNWDFNGEGEDFMDAWVSNAVGSKVFYYNEHLYMIACNPSRGYALMQYSPVFTDRKEIAWLSDFEAEPRVVTNLGTVFFYHGYAYYLTYLYDIDTAWGNLDYQTSFTAWRVKLEEKAEPEQLFSFACPYRGEECFRIGAFQDAIYIIIEHAMPSGRVVKNKEGMDIWAAEFGSGLGRVYRYSEKEDQAELIWSYNGDHPTALFEAEGVVPKLNNTDTYLINDDGDYVYLTGYPEYEGDGWDSTKIASVNLETREGKMLYETPYERINRLKSDGEYYYFLEDGKGQTFLTAIDREGNLVRRYEIPYDEKYIREMEEMHWPREKWVKSSWIGFNVSDSRYIVLSGVSNFKNLSSSVQSYDDKKYSAITDGVGVINTEDFISGKDVEIRQIYERTDPFR